MWQEFFNASIVNTSVSLGAVLLSIGISLVAGLIISQLYVRTNKNTYSENLSITLLFLPVVISAIVMLIGNNIAGAFSLAGVFTIIRFRSAPGSAKDILFILFCVGIGLACGIEAYPYGILFLIAVCVVQIILYFTKYGKPDSLHMQLKIVAPEDLNSEKEFAKILKKYTKSYDLQKIGTKDLGSVYELTYALQLLPSADKKQMIDELRRRNGNLNISLTNRATQNDF